MDLVEFLEINKKYNYLPFRLLGREFLVKSKIMLIYTLGYIVLVLSNNDKKTIAANIY